MVTYTSKTGYKKDKVVNEAEAHQKTYIVYRVSDYNNLIALLKEHSLAVLQIKTVESEIVTGGLIYKVTAQGDKNKLEFVSYLLKKAQAKTKEIIDKTGISENETL